MLLVTAIIHNPVLESNSKAPEKLACHHVTEEGKTVFYYHASQARSLFSDLGPVPVLHLTGLRSLSALLV